MDSSLKYYIDVKLTKVGEHIVGENNYPHA